MTNTDQTCRRTLSEVGSTCQKAARGAGCIWGLAEEAGNAARVLECVGLPGSECVAAILSSKRVCHCTGADSGPSCGIAASAMLSDRIQDIPSDGKMDIGEVVGAILLAAPLIQAARQTGLSYMLSIDGSVLLIGSDGVEGDFSQFDPRDTAKSVYVAQSKPPERPIPATHNSRDIPTKTWTELDRLAAKILVPETEHSRSSGAGPDESNSD
jgi:hypothetical protein